MNRFVEDRATDWAALEALLGRARGKPERLPAADVLRLGALYRAATADLAIARRRLPGDPALVRLERLVAQGHQVVYADATRRGAWHTFFTTGYWRLVRRRGGAVLVAAALLLVPALLGGLWAHGDPGAALGLVPSQFRQAVEPVGDTGMSSTETAEFSSSVLTNNIGVTLQAFAAGILLCLGTAAVLIFNGATLGVLAGGAADAGNGRAFVGFVAPHGIIELSCIVVAAAAGLRLGWAIVAPGAATRTQALVAEARDGVAIVLGTAPWLVVAGIIEGFVTRQGVALVPGLILGIAVGALFWGLVVVRGRPGAPTPAPASSP